MIYITCIKQHLKNLKENGAPVNVLSYSACFPTFSIFIINFYIFGYSAHFSIFTISYLLSPL